MKNRFLAISSLIALAAAGLSVSACAGDERGGDPRSAAPTADFIASLGIGVHMGATGGRYGDIDGVVRDLNYLGFHHVRDGVGGALSGTLAQGRFNPDPRSKLDRFAAIGVRFDVALSADFAKYTDKLHTYAQYIEMIEGPNEPEFTPVKYAGLTDKAAAVALQKDIYTFVKGDPALSDKPVLNFAFARPQNTAAVGDLSSYADYANLHTYPAHGIAPHLQTPSELKATVSAPGKAFIITETGYPTNDPSGPPGARTGKGHGMVDEDVQAKYLLDAALDAFKEKVVRTYLYELYDDPADPQNTDPEAHYGLFRADASRKPAADAFHNLVAILSASGPSSGSGATPNWTVQFSPGDAGADAERDNLMLKKPNGAIDLIFWAEPALWSAQLQKAPPAAPNTLRIQFGRSYRSVKIYDPLAGATARSTYQNVDSVVLMTVDHPLIVELADQ